ncbi:hypothetical protein KHQ82_05955 [Mycoplasmatota bacterium]|nr:hypothetical protein KHQ82_05955 [Mycoplasmatota bacterium]
MSDKREPNAVVKSSKQQLPKVNSTESKMVIQNKDRDEEINNKEQYVDNIDLDYSVVDSQSNTLNLKNLTYTDREREDKRDL